MNPLIDRFPTKIKVGDEVLGINADYRNCLIIIMAYEDEELTIEEKHIIMLERLYQNIPRDINTAIEQGIKFLNCGEQIKASNNDRVYSFKKDAKYIYSAVSQASGFDLENVDFFHWWKFCYYFLDVSSECTFSNIIALRQKKNKGKLTKDEKQLYTESIEILDLDYEEEQEESEFMRLFNESDGDELRDQKDK